MVGVDGVDEGVEEVAPPGAVVTAGALGTAGVGLGVTGTGDGALDTDRVGADLAGAGRAGRCGFVRVVAVWRLRAGGRAGVLTGASPEVTDSGAPARPTLVDASRLADQATVAVATMPSNAAATHNIARRFTVTGRYSGPG